MKTIIWIVLLSMPVISKCNAKDSVKVKFDIGSFYLSVTGHKNITDNLNGLELIDWYTSNLPISTSFMLQKGNLSISAGLRYASYFYSGAFVNSNKYVEVSFSSLEFPFMAHYTLPVFNRISLNLQSGIVLNENFNYRNRPNYHIDTVFSFSFKKATGVAIVHRNPALQYGAGFDFYNRTKTLLLYVNFIGNYIPKNGFKKSSLGNADVSYNASGRSLGFSAGLRFQIVQFHKNKNP